MEHTGKSWDIYIYIYVYAGNTLAMEVSSWEIQEHFAFFHRQII